MMIDNGIFINFACEVVVVPDEKYDESNKCRYTDTIDILPYEVLLTFILYFVYQLTLAYTTNSAVPLSERGQ